MGRGLMDQKGQMGVGTFDESVGLDWRSQGGVD